VAHINTPGPVLLFQKGLQLSLYGSSSSLLRYTVQPQCHATSTTATFTFFLFPDSMCIARIFNKYTSGVPPLSLYGLCGQTTLLCLTIPLDNHPPVGPLWGLKELDFGVLVEARRGRRLRIAVASRNSNIIIEKASILSNIVLLSHPKSLLSKFRHHDTYNSTCMIRQKCCDSKLKATKVNIYKQSTWLTAGNLTLTCTVFILGVRPMQTGLRATANST